MMGMALLAVMLTQTGAVGTPLPATPVASPPAVRRRVTPSHCDTSQASGCTLKALVVANGSEGLCTDAVMPSDRYAVAGVEEFGFLTRAALVADDAAPVSAPMPAGASENLLVTMSAAEPSRLCIPLHVEVNGRRFRVASGGSTLWERMTGGAMMSMMTSKGFRLAQRPDDPQPYVLGSPATQLSAVRMLGEYLFGTGASSLVSVTVTSDRPKPLLLDGAVRGQTNLSFQIARASLDRLMIRDGTRLLTLQNCRQPTSGQQDYAC